jgi:proliferating cell nuclear antigen PCNA
MDKVVYLKSNEVKIFKIIFDILKDILQYATIEFYKNSKGCGFKVQDISTEKTLMFILKINAAKLPEFYCTNDSYKIGVNLSSMCSLLKSADDADEFIMCVNSDETQVLKLITCNLIKRRETEYSLKLSDLQYNQTVFPNLCDFDVHVIINTEDFHKMCKDMKKIGSELDIRCTNNTIVFSCKGQITERSTTYNIDNVNSQGVQINYITENKNVIIHGVYELAHLIQFSKCSSFCPKLQILMKIKKFPICLRYSVGELGYLTALITTVSVNHTETSDNANEINY